MLFLTEIFKLSNVTHVTQNEACGLSNFEEHYSENTLNTPSPPLGGED